MKPPALMTAMACMALLCILACNGKESRRVSGEDKIDPTQPRADIPARSSLQLKKGEPKEFFGLRFTYLGMVVQAHDPPNDNRTSTTWKFEVVDAAGQPREISYTEGFPGGMTAKPRVKVGYRTYLALEWTQSNDAAIDLDLRRVEVGPKLGVAIPVTLGEPYEFPSLSVTVSLAGERPAYSAEQKQAQLKNVAKDALPAAKRAFEGAVIKTYKIVIREVGGETKEFSVDDNYLYSPFELPNHGKPMKVVLQLNANQLELTVGP